MSGFRHTYLPLILFLIANSFQLFAQEWKTYPYTPDGSLISFPADEGRHPDEPIEWWYIAGHLEGTTSGTPYSFMLCYFYYPGDTLGISYDGFRILNITNEQTGEFQTETMVLNYADLATDHLHIDARLLNYVREYWVHKEEEDGTLIPFEYELSATAGEEALSLSVLSLKPPLIPHGDGLYDQGASSYTYYYSLSETLVEGTLTFEGIGEPVAGKAWVDRQYGTYNPNTEEEYEWFYMQLSNGMDLNIWSLFTPDNRQPGSLNYRYVCVYVDTTSQFTTNAFTLERLSWSRMPGSENCYAQQWRLTSDSEEMDLTFSTRHSNSEVVIPFNFFEGAITASGSVNGISVTGIGFAELVKTYDDPILEIASPTEEWYKTLPITWILENPDDGRPLLYDLSYSNTGENPWNYISREIEDSTFLWSDSPMMSGDTCWFRVEGYSADSYLLGSATTNVITYTDPSTSQNQIQDDIPLFKTYPNPAGDMLWIQASSSMDLAYSILDLNGRLLLLGSYTEEGIRIESLENGLYLLRLEQEGNNTVQRFIKSQ